MRANDLYRSHRGRPAGVDREPPDLAHRRVLANSRVHRLCLTPSQAQRRGYQPARAGRAATTPEPGCANGLASQTWSSVKAELVKVGLVSPYDWSYPGGV